MWIPEGGRLWTVGTVYIKLLRLKLALCIKTTRGQGCWLRVTGKIVGNKFKVVMGQIIGLL